MSGLIAIVGRPNVGKSALFNRIAGKRIAIVHDVPGVTRDRITAEVEARGRAFTLADTGGIGLLRGEKSQDRITRATVDQAELAIDAADVIIMVVNIQDGLVPLDKEVTQNLRSSGKPILLALNKADNQRAERHSVEFSELGIEHTFPVSAIHGRGISALLNRAISFLPTEDEAESKPAIEAQDPDAQSDSAPLKLAIVGRPNVGKSSIINALTKSERVMVSDIPGTTRDSVDVPLTVQAEGICERYVLIDTAGIRKKRRIDDSVEFFSVKRSEDSIERSDITVFVLDAESGITMQDKKIGARIVDGRRACVLVVNKWDLFEEPVKLARRKETKERKQAKYRKSGNDEVPPQLAEFGGWVQSKLFFLDYAPVIFTSAKSGFHLDRLLDAIRYVAGQLRQTVPTGILNRTLRDAIERRQPVSKQGLRLKFYYATQVKQAPPTFLLFVNRKELFYDQYAKYLAGELRKAFGYEGCPIVLVPKARPKTVESIRKHKKGKK